MPIGMTAGNETLLDGATPLPLWRQNDGMQRAYLSVQLAFVYFHTHGEKKLHIHSI